MRTLAVRAHGLREMARLIGRRPGSFLLAVLLAAAAFTVPLAGASIARSVAPLAEQLPLGPEVNLFLASSASPADIRQLQSQLAGRADVSRVEWVSRDEALRALAERTGGSRLAELKVNPLPDVLVVTLMPRTPPAEIEAAVGELRRIARVDSVAADTGWHRQLHTLLRALAAAGALVGGLAACLLVLIVLASVQLQLSGSTEQVRLLRLVGAEPRYIVRPYAYAGALTLAAGAGLATGLAWMFLAAAGEPATELARAYRAAVTLEPLPLPWLAAFVAGAAAVGGLVASIGTRWALRRNPDAGHRY